MESKLEHAPTITEVEGSTLDSKVASPLPLNVEECTKVITTKDKKQQRAPPSSSNKDGKDSEQENIINSLRLERLHTRKQSHRHKLKGKGTDEFDSYSHRRYQHSLGRGPTMVLRKALGNMDELGSLSDLTNEDQYGSEISDSEFGWPSGPGSSKSRLDRQTSLSSLGGRDKHSNKPSSSETENWEDEKLDDGAISDPELSICKPIFEKPTIKALHEMFEPNANNGKEEESDGESFDLSRGKTWRIRSEMLRQRQLRHSIKKKQRSIRRNVSKKVPQLLPTEPIPELPPHLRATTTTTSAASASGVSESKDISKSSSDTTNYTSMQEEDAPLSFNTLEHAKSQITDHSKTFAIAVSEPKQPQLNSSTPIDFITSALATENVNTIDISTSTAKFVSKSDKNSNEMDKVSETVDQPSNPPFASTASTTTTTTTPSEHQLAPRPSSSFLMTDGESSISTPLDSPVKLTKAVIGVTDIATKDSSSIPRVENIDMETKNDLEKDSSSPLPNNTEEDNNNNIGDNTEVTKSPTDIEVPKKEPPPLPLTLRPSIAPQSLADEGEQQQRTENEESTVPKNCISLTLEQWLTRNHSKLPDIKIPYPVVNPSYLPKIKSKRLGPNPIIRTTSYSSQVSKTSLALESNIGVSNTTLANSSTHLRVQSSTTSIDRLRESPPASPSAKASVFSLPRKSSDFRTPPSIALPAPPRKSSFSKEKKQGGKQSLVVPPPITTTGIAESSDKSEIIYSPQQYPPNLVKHDGDKLKSPSLDTAEKAKSKGLLATEVMRELQLEQGQPKPEQQRQGDAAFIAAKDQNMPITLPPQHIQQSNKLDPIPKTSQLQITNVLTLIDDTNERQQYPTSLLVHEVSDLAMSLSIKDPTPVNPITPLSYPTKQPYNEYQQKNSIEISDNSDDDEESIIKSIQMNVSSPKKPVDNQNNNAIAPRTLPVVLEEGSNYTTSNNSAVSLRIEEIGDPERLDTTTITSDKEVETPKPVFSDSKGDVEDPIQTNDVEPEKATGNRESMEPTTTPSPPVVASALPPYMKPLVEGMELPNSPLRRPPHLRELQSNPSMSTISSEYSESSISTPGGGSISTCAYPSSNYDSASSYGYLGDPLSSSDRSPSRTSTSTTSYGSIMTRTSTNSSSSGMSAYISTSMFPNPQSANSPRPELVYRDPRHIEYAQSHGGRAAAAAVDSISPHLNSQQYRHSSCIQYYQPPPHRPYYSSPHQLPYHYKDGSPQQDNAESRREPPPPPANIPNVSLNELPRGLARAMERRRVNLQAGMAIAQRMPPPSSPPPFSRSSFDSQLPTQTTAQYLTTPMINQMQLSPLDQAVSFKLHSKTYFLNNIAIV